MLIHNLDPPDLEFVGKETYPVIDKNGNIKYVEVQDPEITFSDDRIEVEIERFLHGLTNRLVPVEIPVVGTNVKYYMRFVGSGEDPANLEKDEEGNIINTKNPDSIFQRRMTWCDLFYIAATEAVENRHVLITRFPVFTTMSAA